MSQHFERPHMTNFEFKARLHDARQVQSVMQQHGVKCSSVMLQTDTYFRVPRGRLKLREISFLPTTEETQTLLVARSELIFYQRPDSASVKRSDYLIAPVMHEENLREVLSACLGLRVVVKKRRDLFLLGYGAQPHRDGVPHIRVHLDQVESLGSFVEVEAVVGDGIAFEQAESEAQNLLQQFGVQAEDLMTGSYADLLENISQ